jgi:hypothetical protein
MKPSSLLVILGTVTFIAALLVLWPRRPAPVKSGSTGISQVLRRVESQADKLARDFEKEQEARRSNELAKAFESGKAVRIKLPYRPAQTGEWGEMERAIVQFAHTNAVEIIQFEEAGSQIACVDVWAKDAAKLTGFLRSMGVGNEPVQRAGASGSAQETNGTSSTAGSGR